MSKEQKNDADQENRDRWEANRIGKWLDSSEEALFRKAEASNESINPYKLPAIERMKDLHWNGGGEIKKINSDEFVPAKEGIKFDTEKAPMALIPSEALEEIAKALAFGEKRYGSWNWAAGMSWSRLASAALRHLFAWLKGETYDPDSGLNHLSHCACNLLFLITSQKNNWGTDDRHKRS